MGASTELEALGRKVVNRLTANDALRGLNRVILPVALGLGIFVVVLRLTGASWQVEVMVTGAVVLSALLIQAVRSWIRRPTVYEGLAYWDGIRDPGVSLASASFFARETDSTPGQQLHLQRAAAALPERESHWKEDLPRTRFQIGWWALLVAALLPAFPWGRTPLALEDRLLTEDMAEAAQAQAEALAQGREELGQVEDLAPEERLQMERLGELLEDTAAMLTEPGERTGREILDALEARAQAAEALAAQLGREESWLSEAMIEPLEQSADTAALAGAIRDRDPDRGAEASDGLAEQLESDPASSSLEDRLELALEESMDRATAEDLISNVGQHLSGALQQLQEGGAEGAASEFRALADDLQSQAQRRRAQEQLEALSEQLREAGAEIANSQLEAMRQLAGPPGGPPPEGAAELAEQAPEAAAGDEAAAPDGPGASHMEAQPPPPGGIPPGAMAGPVPGMPPPGGSPFSAPVPGMGEGMASPPGLSAPVPGQAPGPGAGVGGSSSSGNVPGLNAGFGTAEMKPAATELMGAGRDELVQAQAGTEGAAHVRTLEGEVPSREDARRSTREVESEFLAVEEEALDEKALPVPRQHQVRRYFNALRKRFEESEPGAGSP